MSIGEVGDNIRGAAEVLPFDRLDDAYERVYEAFNIASAALAGHESEEVEKCLRQFGVATERVEELQRLLPQLHANIMIIADRLGTLAGNTLLSPSSARASASQPESQSRPLPQLPKLAKGFAPYDFGRQKRWGRQVLNEAVKVFGDRNIEEVEAENCCPTR